MARPSNKEQILREGAEVVRRRGFNGAGVRDITAAAGVPQGSFSNHFASKEEFGLEIVDRYFADVRNLMEQTLRDQDRPPLDRLRSYFEAITIRFEGRDWRDGCLIGNLSLEASETSERMRQHLANIYESWQQPFAECLTEAARAGHIQLAVPATEMAAFLLSSWQGAILAMKVTRSPEPLERFKRIIYTIVLR